MIGMVRKTALAAAAVATLALAACSSSASGGKASGSAGGPTAKAGNAADSSLAPVTIGYINEDSGPQGQLDSPNGASATVAYINAELGGIDKHPVKLVKCSSDGSAEAVQTCAQQFLNDTKMLAVIVGTLQSGDDSLYTTLAGKKALIGATPASQAAFGAKDAYWYGSGSFGVIPGFGVFATKLTGVHSAAIVYLDVPSLKATVTGLLKPVLDKAGIKTKLVPLSLTGTDAAGPLTAAGASSADLLIPITGAPQCIQIAKAVAQLNIKAKVVASPICMDESVLKAVGSLEKNWYEVQIGTGTASANSDLTLFKHILSKYGNGHDGQYAYAIGPITLTLAKQLQQIGYSKLTTDSVRQAIKSYTGPVPLMAPSIQCGAFPAAPSVCNAFIRAYQWDGSKLIDASKGYIKIG
ncbi:MAG: ABC transporter substrate-binding protein [Streptomyces sp.]|uniref:ABC transporter substrate-binding protein n=1 Tax=Streptomyces sp. TaxID=1931 RepID=UPI0025CFB0E6|nr:ABC transporter substrate-binding protein [Streptomyces sp.]MBW8801006.1 ABC transporter substrate-binding protein [Streptomyces sp.]